jgi:hypothetical protein
VFLDVITTKHASFAKRLLEGAGVTISEDRLFGLGSGTKRDVLAMLAATREGENASVFSVSF